MQSEEPVTCTALYDTTPKTCIVQRLRPESQLEDTPYNPIELYLFAVPLALSQTTNFRLFQTERVCRRQCLKTTVLYLIKKWKKVLQHGRKHCGEWRNCSLRAISPFPTVFSKDLNCLQTRQNQGLFGKRFKDAEC